ncbi:DUF5682 family protein [Propionicicella superfundia]|uniref:DUF5682 family protein n=1 Tax=Propionicicella superfundia TaxID=348582 RepID=UPI0004906999|nr:DUF5682 family protein [Propionicicella superfundia]
MTDEGRVRVLGIRHHGSGSARAVRDALTEHDPGVVLIEGPPEADALVGWIARGLKPPVALLAYEVADPARAAFWPFAVFSPEWQALSWAVENHREVRFIDLPAAVTLATAGDPSAGEQTRGPRSEEPDETTEPPFAASPRCAATDPLRDDPLAVLARTAGYDDPERWWEDAVETQASSSLFTSITEAMAELRTATPPPAETEDQLVEERREAHMRKLLRAALRIHDRVAVVCGAWHAPALSGRLPAAAADQRLLTGLPKVKVATAWVPWTHSRLTYASGYGAGIASPGWYRHLFAAPDAVVPRWFAAVAAVLRRHDLPVSPAHAIEATRLAEALAALRGRPRAGLDEVQEAALAVMCDGNPTTLAYVTRELVVGEELGTVPDGAPLVPLDADLRRHAKSLRLTLAPAPKDLVLDLRRTFDRERSRLLHRLRALDIDWGTPVQVAGTGTFKEAWQVAWSPDFAVAIVLASSWGTTVAGAAAARLVADPGPLPDVTARVEQALLGELHTALPPLLTALDERAAHDADVAHLLDALPALIRAQRYGTVRGTDTTSLGAVAHAMLTRAAAGLPAAAGGLSPDAATELCGYIERVTDVVGMLPAAAGALWHDALRRVLARGDVPGLLAGRLTRTLLDAGDLPADAARDALSRALTHGPTVAERAAFAEGFLSASALLLIHDPEVLAIVDDWMAGLADDDFLEVLPVLRRAFGGFNRPERTAIAERATRLSDHETAAATPTDLPYAEMAEALATVRHLLRRKDA